MKTFTVSRSFPRQSSIKGGEAVSASTDLSLREALDVLASLGIRTSEVDGQWDLDVGTNGAFLLSFSGDTCGDREYLFTPLE